jgi:putative inorganic carbon (hco3(-)) transporter
MGINAKLIQPPWRYALLVGACLIWFLTILTGSELFIVLGVILSVAACLIVYDLTKQAAVLLAFCIPIGFSIPVLGSAKIQFPSELLLLCIGICLAFYGVFSGQVWKYFRLFPLPVVWLIFMLPPVFLSQFPIISMKFWLVQFGYVMVFFYGGAGLLMRLQYDDKTTFSIIWAYFAGVLPVLIFAAYNYAQYEFNPVTRPGIFLPFFNDHTLIGASLALLVGFALGLVKNHPKLIVIIALGIIGILMGASRAAIIGIGALPFAILFYRYKPIRWFTAFFVLGIAILITVAPSALNKIDTGNKRDFDSKTNLLEHTTSVLQFRSDYSNLERINRWVSAIEMAKERPVFGFGPGTYQYTYIPYQNPQFKTPLRVRNPDNPPKGSGGTAHSEFLLQLSESGLAVLIVFVLILTSWVLQAIKVQHSKLAFAAFLGLSTYAVHMHANNFLDIDKFAGLFWFFGAIIQTEFLKHGHSNLPNKNH